MKPSNLLFIMSDQHGRKVAGCYGNPLAKTLVPDRLAAGGTLFENAYTGSPICVPARAGLATGRQVHETRCWDNASPYTGQVASWGHRLQSHGLRVESIGKLHYRNEQDDTGFDRQHVPLHVVKGIGDALGSVKDPMPLRKKAKNIVSKDPAYRDTVKRMESKLHSLVDPEAIDAQAKSDQRAIVERNGGREKVVSKGMFGHTPAPGETAEYG